MKRVVSILCAFCFLSIYSFGQTHEAGISIGVSNFLGDLGKKEPRARSYFGDIEASLFKPAVGIFYRNTFNHWVAFRGAFTYTQFEGDDKLANTKELRDDAWYRNYRNLHFKSHAFEVSAMVEVNLMKYVPGSSRFKFAPYVFTGIAMLRFNPKAKYYGEWVELQPIGTEGQGMPQYPDRHKYSLFQPTLPIGIGLKYNINKYLSLGIEFGHRFTFTDYIDDVSTTYVSEQEFIDFDGYDKGSMAYDLSRRSSEIDPEETYGAVTTPGEVRGNPGGKDGYLFSSVTVTYKLANNFSEFSYSGRRPQVRKHPVKRKRVKKYRRHIKGKTW